MSEQWVVAGPHLMTRGYDGPMEHVRFTREGDGFRYERRNGPPQALIANDPRTHAMAPPVSCPDCKVVGHDAVRGVGLILPCSNHSPARC